MMHPPSSASALPLALDEEVLASLQEASRSTQPPGSHGHGHGGPPSSPQKRLRLSPPAGPPFLSMGSAALPMDWGHAAMAALAVAPGSGSGSSSDFLGPPMPGRRGSGNGGGLVRSSSRESLNSLGSSNLLLHPAHPSHHPSSSATTHVTGGSGGSPLPLPHQHHLNHFASHASSSSSFLSAPSSAGAGTGHRRTGSGRFLVGALSPSSHFSLSPQPLHFTTVGGGGGPSSRSVSPVAPRALALSVSVDRGGWTAAPAPAAGGSPFGMDGVHHLHHHGHNHRMQSTTPEPVFFETHVGLTSSGGGGVGTHLQPPQVHGSLAGRLHASSLVLPSSGSSVIGRLDRSRSPSLQRSASPAHVAVAMYGGGLHGGAAQFSGFERDNSPAAVAVAPFSHPSSSAASSRSVASHVHMRHNSLSLGGGAIIMEDEHPGASDNDGGQEEHDDDDSHSRASFDDHSSHASTTRAASSRPHSRTATAGSGATGRRARAGSAAPFMPASAVAASPVKAAASPATTARKGSIGTRMAQSQAQAKASAATEVAPPRRHSTRQVIPSAAARRRAAEYDEGVSEDDDEDGGGEDDDDNDDDGEEDDEEDDGEEYVAAPVSTVTAPRRAAPGVQARMATVASVQAVVPVMASIPSAHMGMGMGMGMPFPAAVVAATTSSNASASPSLAQRHLPGSGSGRPLPPGVIMAVPVPCPPGTETPALAKVLSQGPPPPSPLMGSNSGPFGSPRMNGVPPAAVHAFAVPSSPSLNGKKGAAGAVAAAAAAVPASDVEASPARTSGRGTRAASSRGATNKVPPTPPSTTTTMATRGQRGANKAAAAAAAAAAANAAAAAPSPVLAATASPRLSGLAAHRPQPLQHSSAPFRESPVLRGVAAAAGGGSPSMSANVSSSGASGSSSPALVPAIAARSPLKRPLDAAYRPSPAKLPQGVALATAINVGGASMMHNNHHQHGEGFPTGSMAPRGPPGVVQAIVAAALPPMPVSMSMSMAARAHTPPMMRGGNGRGQQQQQQQQQQGESNNSPTLAVAVASSSSPTPSHPGKGGQGSLKHSAKQSSSSSPAPPFSAAVQAQLHAAQQAFLQPPRFPSSAGSSNNNGGNNNGLGMVGPLGLPIGGAPFGLGGFSGLGGMGGLGGMNMGGMGMGMGMGFDHHLAAANAAAAAAQMAGIGVGPGSGGGPGGMMLPLSLGPGGLGVGAGLPNSAGISLATLPSNSSFATLPSDLPLSASFGGRQSSFSPSRSPSPSASPSPDASPVESSGSPLPLPMPLQAHPSQQHRSHARTGSMEFTPSAYRDQGHGAGATMAMVGAGAGGDEFLRADLRGGGAGSEDASEAATPALRGASGLVGNELDDELAPLHLARNLSSGTTATTREPAPETPRTVALSQQLSSISWEGRRGASGGEMAGGNLGMGAPFALHTPPAPSIPAHPGRFAPSHHHRDALPRSAGPAGFVPHAGSHSMFRSASPPHPSHAMLPANQAPLHIGGVLVPPPRVSGGGGGGRGGVGGVMRGPPPSFAAQAHQTHSPLFMPRAGPADFGSSAGAGSGGMDMLELDQ